MSRGLTCTLIALACLAATAPAASASTDNRRVDLKAITDARAVSAIAEIRDRDKTWRGSTGTTDLTTKTPVRSDGRFRIGSVTKTFVATTALQLVGEHRLSLADPVERHLPGLVPNGQNITVRQLLDQTSGLFDPTNESTEVFPDINDPAVFRTWVAQGGLNRTFTPRSLVAKAVKHDPYFAPGTKWGYSNTNYTLVGMIIEKVTGHPYGQEVSARILRPLGMTDTSVPGRSTKIPGPHAHSYWTTIDGTTQTDVDVTEHNPSWAGAAGEIISTTDDLLRFQRALLNGKLLRPQQWQEMTTLHQTDPGSHDLDYGMGLARAQLTCGPVWGHNGGTFGFTTQLWGTQDRQVALSYTPRGDEEEQTAQNIAGLKFLETAFCGRR
ncbi:serine hydrolase domain-containing protein [Actinokineospora sp. NBRC 105648]|uniref:serine hydrolase domain-containing protein n=1 Tax=Actinokineospora sp. NBRC 105648 TaxID=3032206 RepID=UPI00249FB6E8|nr:serine hydrolase domain-containing protein [Actinokineospora sp. NBRC 105648]GLZ37636.1 serine hydrolase [Actinokineospora sp. NBRC 105648]